MFSFPSLSFAPSTPPIIFKCLWPSKEGSLGRTSQRLNDEQHCKRLLDHLAAVSYLRPFFSVYLHLPSFMDIPFVSVHLHLHNVPRSQPAATSAVCVFTSARSSSPSLSFTCPLDSPAWRNPPNRLSLRKFLVYIVLWSLVLLVWWTSCNQIVLPFPSLLSLYLYNTRQWGFQHKIFLAYQFVCLPSALTSFSLSLKITT